MLIGILIIALFVLISWRDWHNAPRCNWCGSKHYGRCMFNPRAGKVLANTNDGHFNYCDPNK